MDGERGGWRGCKMQSLASAVQVGWYAGGVQEKENKFGNIICLEPENCSRLWIYPGCIGAYGSLRKREIGVGKSGRSKGLRPHQGLSLGEVGIRRVVRNDMLGRRSTKQTE